MVIKLMNFLLLLIGGLIITLVGVGTVNSINAYQCNGNIIPAPIFGMVSCNGNLTPIYGFNIWSIVGILTGILIMVTSIFIYTAKSNEKKINLSTIVIVLAVISLINFGGYVVGFILVLMGALATRFGSKNPKIKKK